MVNRLSFSVTGSLATVPKMGPSFGATIRILLTPDSEAQFWVPKTEPKIGPKIEQKFEKIGKTPPKSRPKGAKNSPAKKKLGHLEIAILWVHVLACFPKSRFHVAAKVHTY